MVVPPARGPALRRDPRAFEALCRPATFNPEPPGRALGHGDNAHMSVLGDAAAPHPSGRVRAGLPHMGERIDGLERLARATAATLHCGSLNLSAMALAPVFFFTLA